jgi:hypothetical protein
MYAPLLAHQRSRHSDAAGAAAAGPLAAAHCYHFGAAAVGVSVTALRC